ncbi:MAG: gephyrin-like molybdotransferase Glp [Pseudomonadota bacterium]
MTAARVRIQPNCEGEDPDLLPVSIAYERIAGSLIPITETESVPLTETRGRVLSDEIIAPHDVPPHRNSAMDGYAVCEADLPKNGIRTLKVVGTAWAGKPYKGEMRTGETVRVMTGARMPDEANTVVMQEQAEQTGDTIRIDNRHKVGQNVRQAGEDLRVGASVLPAGRRIGPAELGLLASLGLERVRCFRRLRVAVFSTGDEVRIPGQPLESGAIYDSNRYTLRAMLERFQIELHDLGVLPDDRDAMRAALDDAGRNTDVIVTSGGVSAGAADFVKPTLEELGQVGFWKIAIRPGRPLAFGRINSAAFFGLPGNPVAVMVTFYQFVREALRALAGETDPHPEPLFDVTLKSRLRKKPGRIEYYRAVVERAGNGALTVRATGATGSGLLHTMSDANCFIVLPEEADTQEPGATVRVQPFYGLI